MFRRVKGFDTRVTSSKRSDRAKSLEMKKIQVNLQVTAMISILECIGNVIHIVLLAYFKGTHFIILIHTIILYSILLPRALLMNTSANKTRILESGWTNVLKNIFGKSSASSENHANSSSNNDRTNNTNDSGKNHEANKFYYVTLLLF